MAIRMQYLRNPHFHKLECVTQTTEGARVLTPLQMSANIFPEHT